MTIEAQELGKRFQKDWIFRNFNYQFSSGHSYAIIGPNGSGKSTLLKTLSGMMPPTTGKVLYTENEPIGEEEIFRHLLLAAPYLELVEEFTLKEFLEFHFKFKSLLPGESIESLLDLIYLKDSENKLIRNFSSGMKQRLKLGLCFFSDIPIILLDEPTSNLDKQGIEWYHNQLKSLIGDRLLLICSNIESEYAMCDFQVDLSDFK